MTNYTYFHTCSVPSDLNHHFITFLIATVLLCGCDLTAATYLVQFSFHVHGLSLKLILFMKESLKVVCFQCLTSSCSWSFWAFVLVVAPDSPDDNKVCRCHTRPVGAGPGSSYRCHSCRKTRHTVTNPQENSWSRVFEQPKATTSHTEGN